MGPAEAAPRTGVCERGRVERSPAPRTHPCKPAPAGCTASPLPGLDAAAIRQLAGSWSDEGFWEDIEWLSERFWLTSGDEHVAAWHHLVLAVGNFKRQPGRRLRPARLAHLSGPLRLEQRPSSFDVPGTEPPATVAAEDAGGWHRLSKELPGAAEATTTTLLAALWPNSHLVFDWRVRAAANALRIRAELPPTSGVNANATDTPPLTFDDYELVREWALGVADSTGERLSSVERALYRLSQLIPAADARTWFGYAKQAAAALSSLST